MAWRRRGGATAQFLAVSPVFRILPQFGHPHAPSVCKEDQFATDFGLCSPFRRCTGHAAPAERVAFGGYFETHHSDFSSRRARCRLGRCACSGVGMEEGKERDRQSRSDQHHTESPPLSPCSTVTASTLSSSSPSTVTRRTIRIACVSSGKDCQKGSPDRSTMPRQVQDTYSNVCALHLGVSDSCHDWPSDGTRNPETPAVFSSTRTQSAPLDIDLNALSRGVNEANMMVDRSKIPFCADADRQYSFFFSTWRSMVLPKH
ncbi:hypothetical protein VUR80DRAFT_9829 [Thermomyces stellatus]